MRRLSAALIVTLIFICGVSGLELQSYTACYGTTGLSHFLRPTCSNGKIALMGVYMYAKKQESGCPITIDFSNQATTPASCCEYDPGDCGVFYQEGVYRAYYQICNGLSSCNIQVASIPTPCDQVMYLEKTNYMKMDYYCVSDQVLDSCENLVTTDSPTFLRNSGYPSFPMSGSTCSCSIEVDCDTTIRITALDLRLRSTGGECKQSIVIEDGGSTARFDCTSNNDYLPTVLYTSTSHYIEISVNNELGTTGGYYFISVQGANPSGSIRLSCGTASQNSPNMESFLLPMCSGVQSTTISSVTTNLDTTEDVYTSLDTSTLASSTLDDNAVTSSTKDSATSTALTTDEFTIFSMSTEDRTSLDNLDSSVTMVTDDVSMTTKDLSTSTLVTTTDSVTSASTPLEIVDIVYEHSAPWIIPVVVTCAIILAGVIILVFIKVIQFKKHVFKTEVANDEESGPYGDDDNDGQCMTHAQKNDFQDRCNGNFVSPRKDVLKARPPLSTISPNNLNLGNGFNSSKTSQMDILLSPPPNCTKAKSGTKELRNISKTNTKPRRASSKIAPLEET